MKSSKFLFSALFVFSFFLVEAQVPDAPKESEDIMDLDETEEDTESKNVHWNGFDIGFGTILTEGTNPMWKATDVNVSTVSLNLLSYKLPIFKHYFGITTGLGVGFNSINMKQYSVSHPSDTIIGTLEANGTYKRNTFTYYTLNAPILFEFCTNEKMDKSFYLSAGAVGYWNFAGTWNTKGENSDGDKFNNTVSSNFDMSHFGAYATVRTGYSKLGVYANYNLTPLFKKEATDAIYPLTFGVSFNLDY